MAGLITGDAFTDLFRQFEHTAYRLEVRTIYGVPEEDEPFQRFLAGEDPSTDWFEPWLALMREQTSQGKRVERVRVVDEPPSDYLRFEIWGTPHNLAAGEDIRYLTRSRANELGLPNEDTWLFDSKRLARLHFDGQNRPLGASLHEDLAELVQYNYWRDTAWHYAETFDTYSRRSAVTA